MLAFLDTSAGHCPVSAYWNHWQDTGGGLHIGLAHLLARASAQRFCPGQEQHTGLVHWRVLGIANVIPAECHRDQRIYWR